MKDGLKELNFCKHRIRVRIEGFRTDKLIDMAFRKGIAFKELKMISDTEIVAWIAADDLQALKKLAKSTYRITTICDAGAGKKLRAVRSRPFMAVGVIITAAVIILRSLVVMTISVDGYKAIPEQSLRQCMSEAGIYEGAFRPSINWDKARSSLYETFPQITWIKLGYDGMTVRLDIAETENAAGYTDGVKTGSGSDSDTDSDFVPDSEFNSYTDSDFDSGAAEIGQEMRGSVLRYTDLTAAKSGYVESIEPLWGEARVEVGDYVKKGQILIGGCIPIEPTTFDENAAKEYYVKSRGEVWARVPYRLNFAQERYISAAAYAGEEQSNGGIGDTHESGDAKDRGESGDANCEYDKYETSSRQNDGEMNEREKKVKPAEKEIATVVNKRERTIDEIKFKAGQQIRLWAKENLPENAEIINKSLNFTAKGNIIEVGVTLEVRQEITEEQEIIVGQENSDYRRD